MKKSLLTALMLAHVLLFAQNENMNYNKFKQLKQELATPNVYRTASGAPGHAYYQQRADYDMKIELDDDKQKITGSETITYYNNSPDELRYLWIQLDQNVRAKDSDTYKVQTNSLDDGLTVNELQRLHSDFDGGFKIQSVTDAGGKKLKHVINKTMMRIDLPRPLAPKASYSFKIKWWYNINDRMKIGGRSGYEYFAKEDNYLYTIAQFYPRMCVYNEVEGWQNKQFLGRGEFTLTFGNFKVAITVPEDHIVASTGMLQNGSSILTTDQKARWKKALNSFDKPVIIANQDEAIEREKKHAKKKKTWIYKAENVRDFAFASSRKFIWDAQAVKIGGKTVMAMSYYPKEGNPLWERYSTKVVAHTIKTYSKYTVDYNYPVAISVHAADIGMEYPMICFNFGRPEEDGTYNPRTKYGMIGVIIHEVGHNFFPMIINSDERQWTWMDEGLNTFVQYLTEQEWERGYPSRRGPAYKITDYMAGDKSYITPIMTNSESIYQFGNNAYGKPATALNILRETVLGRELFDYSFKEYCRRWAFKHPTPADFFRTMEDASGVDLDWFWRGWFFTTDHCDQAIENVDWYQIDTQDPEVEFPISKKEDDTRENRFIGNQRNKTQIAQTITEKDPETVDFYTKYDPYEVTILDKQDYDLSVSDYTDDEKKLLTKDFNYYQVTLVNRGGLVMPVILNFTYEDGSQKLVRIPAEIWRMNDRRVQKVFVSKKKVKQIELDPHLEIADTDESNNYWPSRKKPNRFQIYKENWKMENPMQRKQRAIEMERKLLEGGD